MAQGLFVAGDERAVVEEFAASMRAAYGPGTMVMLRTRGLPAGSYRVTRFRTPDGRELVPPALSAKLAEQAPLHSGGLVGRVIAEARPTLLREVNVAEDDPLGDWLKPCATLMAVPLLEKSYHSDWLLIGDPPEAPASTQDLEQLFLNSIMVGVVLRNLRVAAELRDANAWISKEVDHIAGIQRALIPHELPSVSRTQLAASYGTYDRAGGDYYDVIRLPGERERWLILIADASGHGPSAAVIVAMLHAILHGLEVLDQPAHLLEHINRRLFARRIGNSFVTAWCGVYDAESGDLRFAGAGHPAPLLRRAETGIIEEMDDVGGIPLGVLDEVGSREGVANLHPGDVLLLYTDGVSESMSPRREMFGTGRVRAVMALGQTPEYLIEGMKAELLVHEAGQRPADDQTMVALRRLT